MKMKKWTALMLAGMLALSFTACGQGSSGLDAGKTDEKKEDSDSFRTDGDEEADENEVSDESEVSGDLEKAWSSVPVTGAVIDGRMVSYGPITVELPEGYVVEDKSASQPTFYAVDGLQDEYQPRISFSDDMMNVFTSDSDANRESMERGIRENVEKTDGAEFGSIISYEETTLGTYDAIWVAASFTYNGIAIAYRGYSVYEKRDETGNCVMVEYYGAEGDDGHLAEAEAAMESAALVSDDYESGSILNLVSGWERIFNSETTNPLVVEGTKVTYGPLQMELPEGYAVEDETADIPMFYSSDGSENVNFNFTTASYYMDMNREALETTCKDTYSSLGYDDVQVEDVEFLDLDGYHACKAKIICKAAGAEMRQIAYFVFESTDELYSNVIMVTYTGAAERDAMFDSIKIVE